MDFLKKIDWASVGVGVLFGIGGAIVLRTVENVFPAVQNVTRFPENAAKKLFG